jgi:hypothetical protein
MWDANHRRGVGDQANVDGYVANLGLHAHYERYVIRITVHNFTVMDGYKLPAVRREQSQEQAKK